MEVLIKLGARDLSRQRCLDNILSLLSNEILKDDNFCNRAFRIYEEKYFNEWYGKEEAVFKIQEIKVETDCLRIPIEEPIYPSNGKKKFNLKERIRILFKGC